MAPSIRVDFLEPSLAAVPGLHMQAKASVRA